MDERDEYMLCRHVLVMCCSNAMLVGGEIYLSATTVQKKVE